MLVLSSLPLSLLLLTFTSPFLLANAARPQNGCIHTGDEKEINRILDYGGRGTQVALCPRSLFRLQSPILFTAENQALYTEGYPTDESRAMLIVEGQNQSMAIKGDCTSCSNIAISSLVIDGNRPLLLRVPLGEALVELGNANNQLVENCKLYEPRGWSALHFREGDWKSCSGGIIRGNEIGPCGEEWDPAYDGTEEKSPPFGNPRSDGISLACMDSLVEKNTVYDTTDGAIVIFGSRGSVVQDNTIYSRTRTVLGGINLVDVPPWEGDYTSVLVTRNHVSAFSAYLKVAINIGPATWSDDTESIVSHGTVKDNTVVGTHLGYGYVVASCKNFTVVDNVIGEGSKFGGVMGERCPEAPGNAPPRGFLINKGSSEGVFQSEFVNGEVQHVICIEPTPGPGEDGLPRRLRDSPMAIAAAKAAFEADGGAHATHEANGGEIDAHLTEALVIYQMSVLQAVGQLEGRVHDLTVTEETRPRKKKTGKEKSPFTLALNDLQARLANLESDRRQLRSTFEGLKGELQGFNSRFNSYETSQSSLLTDVLFSSRRISSLPASPPPPAPPSSPNRLLNERDDDLAVLRALQHHEEDHADELELAEGEGGDLGNLVFWFLVMQVVFVGANWGWKKWELRRKRTSGRKRGMSQGLRMMY
ncbi:hypothetical protein BDY24DRAFT_402237 [Mrakia frigida]|uniref:right-handed parallel beta-helix repeat-containing protein n=1 Tax=Mrakia frigida TaxID=29902 RepID=UPI003FCBFF29